MRKQWSQELLKYAPDSYYLITPDIGQFVLHELQTHLKKNYINMGVTEPHSVDFAAGLSTHLPVVIYSIAGFLALRSLEQIKISLTYDQRPVCIIASGGNYYYGHQGITHYCPEDLSLLSNYPNLKLRCPNSFAELRYCLSDFFEKPGPTYLRLDTEECTHAPIITTNESSPIFEYQQGNKISVLCLGTSLLNSVLAHPRSNEMQIIGIPSLDSVYLEAVIKKIHSAQVVVLEETGAIPALYNRLLLQDHFLPNRKTYPLFFKKNTDLYPVGSKEDCFEYQGLSPWQIHRFLDKILNEYET